MIDLATGELAPRYGTASTACGNRREAVCPACSARCTSATPGSSSARAWPEARASPRRSPRIRACSPPSPPRPSARSTPAGCAARPCCPAVPAATPRRGAARTAGISPARPGTSRAIPGSASRCARPATTTNLRCCSTPTRRTCGAGSSPTCPGTWPAAWASPRSRCGRSCGIRFVKVAEYQARGVVHFHAVIRLDAPGEDYQPPPPGITADLLCDAIGQAAAAVRLVVDHDGQAVTLGFGSQTDTRIVRHGRAAARHRPGRSTARPSPTTSPSTPPRPSPPPACPACGIRREADLGQLRCSAHYRAMITTAWQLGGTRPRPGSGPGRTCSATAGTS